MRHFVYALLLASVFAAHAPAQTPRVGAEDLRRLTGPSWKGTLVYLDYGSDRRVSIRSNLTVTRAPGAEAAWVFEYEYPDEPKANGRQTLKLGGGGTTIDDETIVERAALGGGALRIVTERRGKDNDRPALFRYTYLIGASSFSIRKEVRAEGASEFFERNCYSWTR
jgi:hypothetical protein